MRGPEFITNICLFFGFRRKGFRNTWIGIQDIRNEGRFVYDTSGKPITFATWSRGEPNNRRNEDCAEYRQRRQERAEKWNDSNCERKRNFICELL